MGNIHWVLNALSHSLISLLHILRVHNVPRKSFLFNRHFDKIWELKVNTTDRALILMGLCSNDRKYLKKKRKEKKILLYLIQKEGWKGNSPSHSGPLISVS